MFPLHFGLENINKYYEGTLGQHWTGLWDFACLASVMLCWLAPYRHSQVSGKVRRQRWVPANHIAHEKVVAFSMNSNIRLRIQGWQNVLFFFFLEEGEGPDV